MSYVWVCFLWACCFPSRDQRHASTRSGDYDLPMDVNISVCVKIQTCIYGHNYCTFLLFMSVPDISAIRSLNHNNWLRFLHTF